MAAWVMPAVAAGASILSSLSGSKSASKAAAAQIEEQRRQFNEMQRLLSPFVNTGTQAVGQLSTLAGLGGPTGQFEAIQALGAGPEYEAMVEQGERALLQNASATGGLRGGNLQAALAQFRPQVLSQLINQQFGRLGGLAQLGQSSATMQAQQGMQFGQNVGAARAGEALAQGRATGQIINAIPQAFGMYYGQTGGFPPSSRMDTSIPSIDLGAGVGSGLGLKPSGGLGLSPKF